MHYPSHLEKLIQTLRKLPGVGSKSAERYAFEMLDWSQEELNKMGRIIAEIPEKISKCLSCGCLKSESECHFCQPKREEPKVLCILAYPKDAFAIESTHEYKGLYHVLGKLLSPLDGITPSDLEIPKLLDRIEKHEIKEVILALDSTLEGDATALYLKRVLQERPVQVSRLAFGIPMGSSIDYVDGGTLARAFAFRSKY